MNRTNIVTASLERTRQTKTSPLYQYDYGQILRITGVDLPQAYEVHFSNTNTGEATTSIGGPDGAPIPDMYLTSGEPVFAWIFLHAGEDDGETEYRILIPVIPRAMPSDAPPTPEQQSVIDQAIAALNAAVEQTSADAESASGSAETALGHAVEAGRSASAAAGYETGAANQALVSEGYAVGKQNGTDTQSGPYYQNNAKYYKEQASSSAATASQKATAAGNSATAAAGSATAAEGSAEDAEAWAKGTRNGTPVESGDEAYEANAKYYAEDAQDSADAAAASAASITGNIATVAEVETYLGL